MLWVCPSFTTRDHHQVIREQIKLSNTVTLGGKSKQHAALCTSSALLYHLISAWGSWSWYFTVANDWETDRTVDWETDGTVALLSSGKGGSSEACHRQISWQRGIRNRQMIKTSVAQSHPIPTQPFVLFVVLETILSSDSPFLDFYLAMVIERQQTRSLL